jgi:hypothetical protein
MTTFEDWWDNVSEKLADRSPRQVAYHAWHAAIDATFRTDAFKQPDSTRFELHALQTSIYHLARRLEALENPHPGLSDPDPCADGFCPVSMFPPIDDTEGSV